MAYCPRCMRLAPKSCPVCGATLFALPQKGDPVFLVKQQGVWAGVAEQLLKEHRIPYFKQAALGAGITAKLGCYQEEYSYFVPYEDYETGNELMMGVFGGESDDQCVICREAGENASL